MPTFAQFRTGVLGFYNPGGTMSQLAYDAVASYVKYKIEREVNQDLERSKSYFSTYLDRKLMLAGTAAPLFATVKPEVLVRITVDSQRLAIANFVDEYIQEAIDDLTGATNSFELLLKAACVDLQRKVMCYQQNNQSYFNHTNVTSSGFTSMVDLVALNNAEILSVARGRYEAPLAAQAYVADALVQSNGRIYKVTTPGTVLAVGVGLNSINGTEEFIGAVGFKFNEAIQWSTAEAIKWLGLDSLTSNRAAGGPYYTIDPQNRVLYFYPLIIDLTKQVRVQYNGLKTAFIDADVVSFDLPEQEVVANYIKGYLALSITQDQRLAQTSLSLYAAGVRRLWVDCQRRQSTVLSN